MIAAANRSEWLDLCVVGCVAHLLCPLKLCVMHSWLCVRIDELRTHAKVTHMRNNINGKRFTVAFFSGIFLAIFRASKWRHTHFIFDVNYITRERLSLGLMWRVWLRVHVMQKTEHSILRFHQCQTFSDFFFVHFVCCLSKCELGGCSNGEKGNFLTSYVRTKLVLICVERKNIILCHGTPSESVRLPENIINIDGSDRKIFRARDLSGKSHRLIN